MKMPVPAVLLCVATLAQPASVLARPPLSPGKPAGVGQASARTERIGGILMIGSLLALAGGIVILTTDKGSHPATTSTGH